MTVAPRLEPTTRPLASMKRSKNLHLSDSRHIRKQRRQALGGRWPSMSNLSAFMQNDSSDDDSEAENSMRRCRSEPNLQDSGTTAAPWKVYQDWRENNPNVKHSSYAARAFAESLLDNRIKSRSSRRTSRVMPQATSSGTNQGLKLGVSQAGRLAPLPTAPPHCIHFPITPETFLLPKPLA